MSVPLFVVATFSRFLSTVDAGLPAFEVVPLASTRGSERTRRLGAIGAVLAAADSSRGRRTYGAALDRSSSSGAGCAVADSAGGDEECPLGLLNTVDGGTVDELPAVLPAGLGAGIHSTALLLTSPRSCRRSCAATERSPRFVGMHRRSRYHLKTADAKRGYFLEPRGVRSSSISHCHVQ